ncbi:MAG: hypothetical protein HQM10_10090 [Candidatus Riflebacteria bacterium]|nr:hypothetical protein [Candidatus Riflebacteria bacterium]
MKRGRVFWWIVGLFIVGCIFLNEYQKHLSISSIFAKMDRNVNLELLPAPLNPARTILVSSLLAPLATGTNCFYSPCFQAAWNGLLGAKRVNRGENTAVPLLAELDKQLVAPDDMPLEDIFVSFDQMTKKVAAANSEKYAQMFGEQPQWSPVEVGPDTFSLMGAINNHLRFRNYYERFERAIRFNGSRKYYGFGYFVGFESARKQTHILFHEKGGIFGVELTTTSPISIILAQIPREATLLAAIKDVASRTAKACGARESPPDYFSVPLVSLRIRDHGGDLVGKPIIIDGQSQTIGQAENELLFRLNEFGTDTVGTIRIISTLGVARDPICCDFDKPFLILLRKNGRAMPFFAAWIENDKALHQF